MPLPSKCRHYGQCCVSPFGCNGNSTQGLNHARQVLYVCLRTPPACPTCHGQGLALSNRQVRLISGTLICIELYSKQEIPTLMELKFLLAQAGLGQQQTSRFDAI